MLAALKRQVRSWERDGRHGWLTRGLTYLWVQAHNTSDRLNAGRVRAGLADGEPGEEPGAAVTAVTEGDFGKALRPMQVRQELEGLIRLVAERKPRRLVEIGTARGGTLLLLCRFAAPDAVIVSLDLPYGRNGGGYPRWKEALYRRFAKPGQTLHLLRANSHDPASVAKVMNLLPDGEADFVLIDADHSYDGVKTDFANFAAILAQGGVIALHDILENPEDPSIDVNRFWQEVEADPERKTGTIVHDPQQGAYGIGLVYF